MKPVIGLNCDIASREDEGHMVATIELWRSYAAAVEQAGGIPILFPPLDDVSLIPAQTKLVSGLILIGGGDYDPRLYGAEPCLSTKLLHPTRAAYDLKLAEEALRRPLPVFAICGGLQLVNIVRGGSLERHLPDMPAVRYASPMSIFAHRFHGALHHARRRPRGAALARAHLRFCACPRRKPYRPGTAGSVRL